MKTWKKAVFTCGTCVMIFCLLQWKNRSFNWSCVMALRKHVCLIEFPNVPVFLIKRRTLARDAIFSAMKNLPRRRSLFPYPNFYRIVIFTTTVGYYFTWIRNCRRHLPAIYLLQSKNYLSKISSNTVKSL